MLHQLVPVKIYVLVFYQDAESLQRMLMCLQRCGFDVADVHLVGVSRLQ